MSDDERQMDEQDTITVMLSTGHGAQPELVEIPTRVGTVKLGEMLGEGSGGVVFAGYDQVLNRKVAVKLLHHRRADAGDAAMVELIEGVRSAARIRHPNIVTLHGVETVNQMPVIVMEYVDGFSLRELLRRCGAMDLSLALYVMRSVVSAVGVLHDASVVHRDLKPANVLFDREGEARVCDFGLACEFDLTAYEGGTKSIGGTPLYMASEMFYGRVSPQSDVYALGIMLFEVLAGHPPFSAETISGIRTCHRTCEPPLWQLEARDVPADLCEIVARCLRKQRFLRYKTAVHLLRAIEGVPASERRDTILRQRLAGLIAAGPTEVPGPPVPGPDEPPAGTAFDLLARRAKEKRDRKSR